MTELDVESVTKRALVHDIAKPFEIMRKKRLSGPTLPAAYIPSAYEQLAPLLVELGFDRALSEYIAFAGQETGHSSLSKFITVKNRKVKLASGMFEAKIVHLIDDMTFTSIPKPGERPITAFLEPWPRMLAAGFPVQYPWLWTKGLALGKDKSISECATNAVPDDAMLIGHYADLQVFVSEAICKEFAKLLGLSREPVKQILSLLNRAALSNDLYTLQ